MARGGWSLVLIVTLAGCASGADPVSMEEEEALAQAARFDETTGAVEGVVTDEAILPLVGVTVRPEVGEATTTDAQGRFSLSYLAPGSLTVNFELGGFENATRTIEVRLGEIVSVSLQLVAVGADVPYHLTHEDAGRMMCAADTRPRLFALNFCGAVALFSPATGDDSLGTFTLTGNSSRLVDIVFQTHWVTNQATGRGLEVFWEAYQRITDPTTFPEGAPRRFGSASGVSPLRAAANESTIQAIVHAQPAPLYCHVGAPCMVMARTFPRATTLGPTSPADAAFYVDQRFTHVLTEFYRAPAPPGFSALADA